MYNSYMYTTFKHRFAHESLRNIIKFYQIEKMHIPFYLCDSVRHTLFEEGCKPVFYHIDDNFMPACDFPFDDYILYPNYFGVCSSNVKKLVRIYPKLIVDNAHAFFDKPSGFACFNSAYKFNLGDFSYLWLEQGVNGTGVKYKSNAIMQPFIHEKEIRVNRFHELDKQYSSTNLLKIDKNSVPFCYPYLAKDTDMADELVKELRQQGLTIYRYWNSLPKNYNEYKFYSRLVPIPIK